MPSSRGGDAWGRHGSHIERQFNAPHLAADAANGIWEDGSVNIGRGATDPSWLERIRASAYSAAVRAVDQPLVHRDALINGLMAAGALTVSAFLAWRW